MRTYKQKRALRTRQATASLICSLTAMGLFLGVGHAHDIRAGGFVIMSLVLGMCVSGILALGLIIAATER